MKNHFLKFLSNNKGNTLVVLALLVGLVAGVIWVLQIKGIGAKIKEGVKIEVNQNDPNADPDKDGLKNWEEELYKTDKYNPDTDGDGYTDGEEVASGYDPAKPAPNDALDTTDTSKPRPEPKNLTKMLALKVTEAVMGGEIKPVKDVNNVSDYVLMKNEEAFKDVLAQVAKKAEGEFSIESIPVPKLKISSNPTTKREVDKYLTSVISINTEADKLNISEADAIQKAVNERDYVDLDKIIASYQRGIAQMKNIEVPADFLDLHVRGVQILELTLKILKAIRDFENDPAMASAAAEKYIDVTKLVDKFVLDLINKSKEYSGN